MALSDKPYFLYVLRCEDNSLYAGIATDFKRRYKEHTEGKALGAKYTKSHKPISVEAVWQCADKSSALKLEFAFKKLLKPIKEDIIKNPSELKLRLFDRDDIEFEVYKLKN